MIHQEDLLDDTIKNIILEYSSLEEGRLLLDAFVILNKVEQSKLFRTTIDILALETKLLNFIYKEDFNPIDFIPFYKSEVSLFIADFLDKEGITLSVIKFNIVLEILTSMLSIEEHDITFIDTSFAILNNAYSENEEVFATFVNYMIADDLESDYKSEILESLTEVTDEVINRLRKACAEKLESEDSYTNSSLYMLVKLEKMNKDFLNLKFIQFLFNNLNTRSFYSQDIIKYSLEDLYSICIDFIRVFEEEKTLENLIKILYTCIMFSDSELNKDIIENLNYDVLDIDELKINVIKKTLEDLIINKG